MSKKTYYYGIGNEEYYCNTDIDSAYEEIRDYLCYGDKLACVGIEISEMVKSIKSGVRWCNKIEEFEPECGYCCGCDEYKPRNGKNGICKHLSWGLVETGARWIITGDYEYKKISGRKI
jgi:hypothetical protein